MKAYFMCIKVEITNLIEFSVHKEIIYCYTVIMLMKNILIYFLYIFPEIKDAEANVKCMKFSGTL